MKKPGVSTSRRDKMDPDNISEESFLPATQTLESDGNGAIRKTMQVSVHSDAVGHPRIVEDRL